MNPYQAPWWLPGKHLQTIIPFLQRKPLHLNRKRERVELADGDFIDVDWLPSNDHNSPIVMLLHGLSGCSRSGYILQMQAVLQQQGFTTVAMNHRGCSGEPNRLPRAYHSGETHDAQAVLNHIKQRYPTNPIFVIGYSMGGNILLKWLGEQGSTSQITAGVAISVPFQLGVCAQELDKGFAKTYRVRLIKCIREQLQTKIKHFHANDLKEYADYLENLGDLTKIQSFIEFDHQFTAPLHGFNSGADYYQKCSSKPFLSKVQRPALVIHAQNDPFMTPEIIPKSQDISSSIQLEIFKHGGHVGFFQGSHPFNSECWLLTRIPSYLKTHI